ncbi:MAG TPA: YhdH/YhfP family quinone oxidoreductase [Pirellulales bacterium]|jgi:putative YhdH/YhfP family quinone oxidoreductase|nr:YhdH/YhfP family quinone oxidoreductase [Pirellulales bacterium]
MPQADRFRCYLVTKTPDGKFESAVVERTIGDLPPGEVLVQVQYSSVNYKDALSAAGHPGVTRKFPHVPGIDAAGSVTESSSPRFKPGDEVLVTGFDLGQNTWGGFAKYIRVPADWVVPLPEGLSPREAMIYGTAGFTAAMCLDAFEQHGVRPGDGETVVTGASGGVGSVAVAILARAGYTVVASTGKPEAHNFLRSLGAAHVIDREELHDTTGKSLLPERWAGAVDIVGGGTLATVVRSMRHGGCATACGLVGGHDLPLNVYPFILRGVTLAGIDSVACPMLVRQELWAKLARDWRPAQLAAICRQEIGLNGLDQALGQIRQGRTLGRALVAP